MLNRNILPWPAAMPDPPQVAQCSYRAGGELSRSGGNTQSVRRAAPPLPAALAASERALAGTPSP
ncbi:MAG: hypothetical protein POG24_06740, partial [Acidocella sp.]|nr:hypothetical protein [Acidocella sp.]